MSVTREDLEKALRDVLPLGVNLHLSEDLKQLSAVQHHAITFIRNIQDELQVATAGEKRKANVAFKPNPVCRCCREQFDPSSNKENSCRSHPGSLEPEWDNDYWADTDPDIHGTEYESGADPEAWRWTCCKEFADAKPCRVGKHKEDERRFSKKKLKLGEKDPDDDDEDRDDYDEYEEDFAEE